ncbi:LysE/ArgO family amino acid transporter [Niallia nealsonii]|uniref:Lysine transporter LysE n=1 Tax=Niallia nealsonii TaxID=115979 RepID=A0A2N0Z2M6_9BACI|nr:LysE/ArgO family amino acid transporter [Niallia nealsonii]PKG23754.1 lysine transporter LysE [Niallia nealsonii]
MIQAGIHGFILALGLILPLGVQNLFIFNQGAVQQKFKKAMPAVITASLCDTILICLAVLGVSVILLKVTILKTILLVGGVCFLIYMGYVMWKSKPSQGEEPQKTFTARKQIIFAMSVSLLNPHAIMDTIGVIGTNSLLYSGTEKTVFTILCVIVSWIWFIALAILGKIIGKVDKQGNMLVLLNKISAVIMWGMALMMVLSVF